MLPSPGDVIGGKYRIVRLIGEGGMGVVYEAHHLQLGSDVALKFLHPDLAQRPALVARFLQEARVSASIRSPYVTQVTDVDQTPEGAAYLVMELLEGASLERRLEQGSPLPVSDALEIAVQILAALEAAHARGVVHRDLKPDNVWLSPSTSGPHVKLLDFGIAKIKASSEYQQVTTRPGSVMGTPAYMAPEQAISADQVDQRADLYSFGVMLYEMLSGTRPVDSEEPNVILEHLIRGDVHSLAARCPSLPPGLTSLVDRLVAPNPDKRPSTAAEVRAELVRTMRASAPELNAGRASLALPRTLPPDDSSAPPFVTSSQAAAKVRTDSMPKMPDFALAPTAPATPTIATKPRRRSAWPIVGSVVVAALGGAGVWAYMNPSVFDDSADPPLPGPGPTAVTAPTRVDAAVPGDPNVRREVPRYVAPIGPAPRSPDAPRPPSGSATPPSPFPQFPFPIPVPSGLMPLPFPSSFPSSLPPFFSQLPGLLAPPAAAPSTAPTAH